MAGRCISSYSISIFRDAQRRLLLNSRRSVSSLSMISHPSDSSPEPVPPSFNENDVAANERRSDWHIVMEPPQGNPTKNQILNSYTKLLVKCVRKGDGCLTLHESTKYYYAFSACSLSKRTAFEISKLPEVRTVMCDSSHIIKSDGFFFCQPSYKEDFDYEQHKEMLLEGNYSMRAFRMRNLVCPPNLRGFFPKICELEEWHVVMEPSYYVEGSRDSVIQGYIKTLATLYDHNEEETLKRIRSLSTTRNYYAFNAYLSWKDAYKMNRLPNVKTVLSAEHTYFYSDTNYYHYGCETDSEGPIDRSEAVVHGDESRCPRNHRGISLDACDLKRRYEVLKREYKSKPSSDGKRLCHAFGGLMWRRTY